MKVFCFQENNAVHQSDDDEDENPSEGVIGGSSDEHQSESEESHECDHDHASEETDLDDDNSQSDDCPEYFIDDEGNYVFPLSNPIYTACHNPECGGRTTT